MRVGLDDIALTGGPCHCVGTLRNVCATRTGLLAVEQRQTNRDDRTVDRMKRHLRMRKRILRLSRFAR